MEAIRSINTKNFELSQVQTNLLKVLRRIADKEIIDGNAITNQAISTVATTLAHGLARQPLGFLIIDKNGPGDISRVSWDQNNIVLVSTTAVTASIWIF